MFSLGSKVRAGLVKTLCPKIADLGIALVSKIDEESLTNSGIGASKELEEDARARRSVLELPVTTWLLFWLAS